MKLAKFYTSLSETKQIVFILAAIGLMGCAITGLLWLIPSIGVGGILGFLLGTLIEIGCYISIVYGSSFLMTTDPKGGAKIWLTSVFAILRLALYAGGLFLAAFCTFKWNVRFLNFWTLFAAYLPLPAVLLVHTVRKNKKLKSAPKEAPKNDDQPTEGDL